MAKFESHFFKVVIIIQEILQTFVWLQDGKKYQFPYMYQCLLNFLF